MAAVAASFARNASSDIASSVGYLRMTMKQFDRLVGNWTTKATHPALPGVIVHGSADIEWLEGQRFLIVRSRTDHPDFPGSISIIGSTERDRADAPADEAHLSMHYFDSRGVFRVFDASIDDESWRFSRNAPGFSQRFTGTFAEGGDTIIGVTQLCRDDVHWNDDLKITYRRKL